MHRFSRSVYLVWAGRSRKLLRACLFVFFGLLFACQSEDQQEVQKEVHPEATSKTISQGDDPGLSVQNAYYRLPPPGVDKTAAYLSLVNSGESALTLEAVNSAWVRAIEIHEIVESDGQMRMRRKQLLPLPSNSEVRLQPGGLHLMLFGLSPEKHGEGLPLELQIAAADGQRKTVKLIAKPRDLRDL